MYIYTFEKNIMRENSDEPYITYFSSVAGPCANYIFDR